MDRAARRGGVQLPDHRLTLYPARVEGVEPKVNALRRHLQGDRMLVELRHIAEPELTRISPPLRLQPRPPNVPRAPPGKKTLDGPWSPPCNSGILTSETGHKA